MTRSFQTRADGMVVQESSPEQPPRRFAPPLLSRRGNSPASESTQFIHTFTDRAKMNQPADSGLWTIRISRLTEALENSMGMVNNDSLKKQSALSRAWQ